MLSSHFNSVSSLAEPVAASDWALIKMSDQVIMLPNGISQSSPYRDMLIRRIIARPLHGEVTILVAKMGPQLGYLSSSPATIKVEKSVFDVQLIVLERTLRESPQKFAPSVEIY